MSQFINSLKEVKNNYSKYDDWEQAQADERAKKEYLAANLDIPEDKLELTKQRAQTVIRATEIMDARSEDNCENMEQLTGLLSTIPMFGIMFAQTPLLNHLNKKVSLKYNTDLRELNKLDWGTEEYASKLKKLDSWYKKTLNKNTKIVTLGGIGLTLAVAIGTILWGNSKQKEASRIGRYQAKQNELKGLENFVVYTPEQIEKAKEIAKKIPDEKDRNSISKMIKELKEVSKDKAAYKEWLSKKDPKEIEKLKAVELSPEQLLRAEEDKELIVDAVKEINVKAEEYSENVENAFDTLGNLSWFVSLPLGFGLNKLLKAFKVSPKVTPVVSTLVSVLTPLMIQMAGTFEQKKASRVGRYVARKDLMQNSARLMAYSDEDMKKAEDIKAPKQRQSFFEKLGGSFKFIKQYYKDKIEYGKYRKTTHKQNEKIQKALKKIEVTDAQKAEAKTLQKNVFRAFDEVDEMSQRLSEDTEAGCEIAKQVGVSAWSFGSMGALAWLAVSIKKGKFPISKLINKLTNMSFKPDSHIKKAVNGFYEVLKSQDKKAVKGFQEAFVNGKLKEFLSKSENKALKDAVVPFMGEILKLPNSEKIIEMIKNNKNAEGLADLLTEAIKPELKQTRLAKWTRNMIDDCINLWAKFEGFDGTKKFNYKNYKTVINTGAVAGIPVLGVIFAVPYAFNSWLTSIQKKAGKIGIMKAMDKINDPRVFASEPVKKEDNAEQQSNLLKKFGA